MTNNRSTLNFNTPANLNIREHHAILARLNKHDRELATLHRLMAISSEGLPWIAEVRELRASGYTYSELAQRLGITRDAVSAVLSASEVAR